MTPELIIRAANVLHAIPQGIPMPEVDIELNGLHKISYSWKHNGNSIGWINIFEDETFHNLPDDFGCSPAEFYEHLKAKL